MRRTVLVVDDHPGFRASVRELLAVGPFDIIGEAEDGAGALRATSELRPDLVLLDIALPGSDGIELARELAERADAPAVVLISSRDAADYGTRLRNASARGFIPKAALSIQAIEALLG